MLPPESQWAHSLQPHRSYLCEEREREREREGGREGEREGERERGCWGRMVAEKEEEVRWWKASKRRRGIEWGRR